MIFQTIHIIWTVLLVLIFIGIVVWAWNDKTKDRFNQAQNLPFEDDDDTKQYNDPLINNKLKSMEFRNE